jgi:O-antigen ligase
MLFGRGWKSPWRWGLLVLINVALLVNQSRNAWVALALVGTALILARQRKLVLVYAPLAVLLVILAPAPLLDRIASVTNLGDPSNYDRLCMLQAGVHMVAQRPATGVGPDMVEETYPIYRPATAPRYQRPHLHNSFLQLAAERGLPSLVAYLVMVWISLAAAWRGYRRARGEPEGPERSPLDLYVGVMAALVAFNLAGLFENNWGDTEIQRVVLFLLAVPYCLAGPSEAPEC